MWWQTEDVGATRPGSDVCPGLLITGLFVYDRELKLCLVVLVFYGCKIVTSREA